MIRASSGFLGMLLGALLRPSGGLLGCVFAVLGPSAVLESLGASRSRSVAQLGPALSSRLLAAGID
eukprot:653134-Pyramimonas_sp.AAC.1